MMQAIRLLFDSESQKVVHIPYNICEHHFFYFTVNTPLKHVIYLT